MLDYLSIARAVLASEPRRKKQKGLKKAAVLLPLLMHRGRLSVLFLKRSDSVPRHKKQIGLPGGEMESIDRSFVDTMFREVREEIGLERERVKIVGELDNDISITGFYIRPFLGILDARLSEMKFERHEVDEPVVVPLKHLLDEKNHFITYGDHEGRTEEIHIYIYGKTVIWGITGAIVRSLQNCIERSASS